MDKKYPCLTCGRLDPCRCYQRPPSKIVDYTQLIGAEHQRLKDDFNRLKADHDRLLRDFDVLMDVATNKIAREPATMVISTELTALLIPLGWCCAGCQRQYSPNVKWCLICPGRDEHAE